MGTTMINDQLMDVTDFVYPGSPVDKSDAVDEFLAHVYGYFRDKGYSRGIALRIMHVLILVFTMLFSTFVLLAVNWQHLFHCPAHNCKIIDPDAFVHAWRKPTLSAVCVILYAVLFFIYCAWSCASAVLQILAARRMQLFYSKVLRIEDSILLVASWDFVVARLCQALTWGVQQSHANKSMVPLSPDYDPLQERVIPDASAIWTPEDVRRRLLGNEDALSLLLYSPFLLGMEEAYEAAAVQRTPQSSAASELRPISFEHAAASSPEPTVVQQASATTSLNRSAHHPQVYGTVDDIPLKSRKISTQECDFHDHVESSLTPVPSSRKEGGCTRWIRQHISRKGPGRLLEWNLRLILFTLGKPTATNGTSEAQKHEPREVQEDTDAQGGNNIQETQPYSSQHAPHLNQISVTGDTISARCRTFAAINVFTLPFALVAMAIMFILGHAEELRGNKVTIGARVPSTAAKAIFRRRAELPHLAEARYQAAAAGATKYFSAFPASPLAIILSAVTFASAAAVAVLLLLSFADGAALTEQKLWDRPLLWYLAVATAILAFSRSFGPGRPDNEQQSSDVKTMDQVANPATYVHYLAGLLSSDNSCSIPMGRRLIQAWLRDPAAAKTQSDIANYLPTRLSDFLQELGLAILVPFALLLVIRPRSQEISQLLSHLHSSQDDSLRFHESAVEATGQECQSSRLSQDDETKSLHMHQSAPHTLESGTEISSSYQLKPSGIPIELRSSASTTYHDLPSEIQSYSSQSMEPVAGFHGLHGSAVSFIPPQTQGSLGFSTHQTFSTNLVQPEVGYLGAHSGTHIEHVAAQLQENMTRLQDLQAHLNLVISQGQPMISQPHFDYGVSQANLPNHVPSQANFPTKPSEQYQE